MTAGRRDQLASALRALADATEAMTCDDDVNEDACPKCSQPVQVFSTVGGKVETIFAEVDPLAGALLPVVDRMIRQAQAEALESAAGDVDDGEFSSRESAGIRRYLLSLALTFRVTTDHPDVTQDAPRTPSEPP